MPTRECHLSMKSLLDSHFCTTTQHRGNRRVQKVGGQTWKRSVTYVFHQIWLRSCRESCFEEPRVLFEQAFFELISVSIFLGFRNDKKITRIGCCISLTSRRHEIAFFLEKYKEYCQEFSSPFWSKRRMKLLWRRRNRQPVFFMLFLDPIDSVITGMSQVYMSRFCKESSGRVMPRSGLNNNGRNEEKKR